MSLQPIAIQIINLIDGKSGGDASGFGFEATDGFVAEPASDAFVAETTEDNSSEGDF